MTSEPVLIIIIYRNIQSIKNLGKLIEKWRQFCYFNFSYTEHLEILIVLHIRLLLVSYDSGVLGLGDSIYYVYITYITHIYIYIYYIYIYMYIILALWTSLVNLYIYGSRFHLAMAQSLWP